MVKLKDYFKTSTKYRFKGAFPIKIESRKCSINRRRW
jgi:hypothetical protein